MYEERFRTMPRYIWRVSDRTRRDIGEEGCNDDGGSERSLVSWRTERGMSCDAMLTERMGGIGLTYI
jgi:hypothetical protein